MTFADTKTNRGALDPLLFSLTLLAATVLYLITGAPILAAVLPCLHGGWHTFHTGLWILRSDPYPRRARTCFAFYLATAAWKAAAAALTTVAVFVFLAVRIGFQPNMDSFRNTMLVLAGGVAVNTLIGFGAIVAALVFKLRVWVHPRLLAMTRGDLRTVMVLTPLRSGFNHAIFVIATALAFPVVVVSAVVVAAMTVGKAPDQINSAPIVIIEIGTLLGCPIAMIPCYAWLSSRIIARSPQECWPDMAFHVWQQS